MQILINDICDGVRCEKLLMLNTCVFDNTFDNTHDTHIALTEAYTCHSLFFNFLFVDFNLGKIDFNLGKLDFKLGKKSTLNSNFFSEIKNHILRM